MSGKIFVGNTSNIATLPKNILVGNPNNIARNVKEIYVGNSQNQAVKVWPSGRLPTGYTQLSYIQNNRTTDEQYIDTGYKPDSLTKMFLMFTLLDYEVNSTLFSCSGITNYEFYTVRYNGIIFHIYFGDGYSSSSSLTEDYYNQFVLFFNYSNGVFNLKQARGTEFVDIINTTLTNSFVNNNDTLRLLYPLNNSFKSKANAIRINSCTIWSNRENNNTIVRDYIPARRDDDGINGLYDLKEQQFYPNSYSSSLDYNFYGA